MNMIAQDKHASEKYTSPFDFRLLLSGTFGELRNNHFHAGIDIKTNEEVGRRLYSIADGYISRIKVSTWGYGKVLYINHPDGNTSVYAHMQRFNDEIEKFISSKQYEKESFEIEIRPDEDDFPIKKGGLIGFAGNTGFSGGPHLHFEIRETETQKPLNPLRFGFDVQDDISPVIEDVIIYSDYPNNPLFVETKNAKKIRYAVKKHGSVYSLEKEEIIQVHGNVAFGIHTFDRQNGAPNNRNGIYSIKLFVDSNLIHHFQVDELDFSEKRFINAHIDYEEYSKTKTRFNRCHKLPYNELSNYSHITNNGIINFTDTNLHNIKFEVSDIEKNISILEFQVQSKESKKRNEESNDATLGILQYNKPNIYTNDDFEVHIKKYSLYKNYNLLYALDPKMKTTFSDIHNIMDESTPLHKDVVISIKSDVPKRLQEKVFIAKLEKNNTFTYKGKTWRDKFLSAKTSKFGKYCIVADTNSPHISNIKLDRKENMYGGKGKISVNILDKESGIAYYRGEINGKWILMEYEYKKNDLTYYIPSDFKKGTYKIMIIVKDRMNNEKRIEEEFIY